MNGEHAASNLLPAMVAAARRSAEERERRLAPGVVERDASARTPHGDRFLESLARPGIRIIAECKRRSPSRGILRPEYDPAAIAARYEEAGAAAISVLTETSFFDGSIDHLRSVRAAVDLPILRKDFISIPFQVLEARAAGADAVLLIVAALDDQRLRELREFAASLGLAALVEVHTREELTRAVQAGATCIGVNSRNLRTLSVQPAVFEELVLGIPQDIVAVAESGLRTAEDLRQLRASGYDGFLIGERFMTQPDPGAGLAEVRASAAAELEELR
jgi:indole-3-glycerol phosphate synthase